MTLREPDSAASQLIERVAEHLPATGRLGVAYSGGVDSAVLLAISEYVLGNERTLGFMAISPSFAARERALAMDTAEYIGSDIVEIETHEHEVDGYRENDVDRCYFCKKEMFERVDDELVASHGLVAVAYGENLDDAARIDRPGSRAATEHGVLRPLAQAGLTKADVRQVARAFGLPCADKPAAPCLASRVPHGEEVTLEKLNQIEAVELALYRLGFSDSRVRHHGKIARIELPVAEIERATQRGIREDIEAAGKDAGFDFVAVDLKGIQSGALTLSILNARGS